MSCITICISRLGCRRDVIVEVVLQVSDSGYLVRLLHEEEENNYTRWMTLNFHIERTSFSMKEDEAGGV